MGHLAVKGVYGDLKARLDTMPVGAPGERTIYEILRIVFTEEEADLAARMPPRFCTLGALSRRLKLPEGELQGRLEAMADKGLVLDLELNGKVRYLLAPTVVGFFEYSMMRVRGDIDQRRLAELIYRYIVEEPEFAGQFDSATQTSPFRTLVHEPALAGTYTEILDYERATYLVEGAERWALGLCHCRHSAHHRGRECQAFPMETCMTLGPLGVDWVRRHGLAREIDKAEALDILARSREAGLVHMGDNVQHQPTFLCSCCACCCEVLHCFRSFRLFGAAFSSAFEAAVEGECAGCGACLAACPVGAIAVGGVAEVDRGTCLGCGVCVLRCPSGALRMRARPQRPITPESTFARVLTMAIEQGKLHHLLIDAEASLTARAAHLLVGAILALPAARRVLALEAVKSRFVEFLISRRGRGAGG